MKFGIVISSNEAEEVWNAFRFGNIALKAHHKVKVFLINRGVEIEEIKNKKYNIKEQVDLFIENKGQILACETCLKSRGKGCSNMVGVGHMQDLLKLVEESDRVLTFG